MIAGVLLSPPHPVLPAPPRRSPAATAMLPDTRRIGAGMRQCADRASARGGVRLVRRTLHVIRDGGFVAPQQLDGGR